jgi:serine/threonine protein kinase
MCKNDSIGRGTPGYIAPELIEGKCYGTSPDIYSLGVVVGSWLEIYIQGVGMHYLGSKFTRHTTTSYIILKIKKKLEAQFQRDEEPWPPIITKAARLLIRMLEPDPSQRITAKEILTDPFSTSDSEEFQGLDYESVSEAVFRSLLKGPGRSSDYKIFYRGY